MWTKFLNQISFLKFNCFSKLISSGCGSDMESSSITLLFTVSNTLTNIIKCNYNLSGVSKGVRFEI